MSQKIKVCLTGATGFVAAHILDQLLDLDQYEIHATVRSTSDPSKYAHLTQIIEAKGKQDCVKFFEATLDKEGSFDEAINGCEYVLHTASPYMLDVKNPQKELVDPAVKGTLNVLNSCLKHKVKRVVLTSSVAAITDSPDNDHIYTESDWNTKSSLKRNPYYFSKVEAEKSAWNFVKQQESCFELVVICPSVVIGPEFGNTVNQSNKIFIQLTDGSISALMNLGWAFVDVRDVAKAHVLAMKSDRKFESKDNLQGRYLCCNETKDMVWVCDRIRDYLPDIDGKIPTKSLQSGLGNQIVKLAALFQPKGTRQYMRTNIGKLVHGDNSKIKNELSMSFIDIDQSLKDTLDDLLKKGSLKRKHAK